MCTVKNEKFFLNDLGQTMEKFRAQSKSLGYLWDSQAQGWGIPEKTYQSANFFTSQKLIATVYVRKSAFITFRTYTM